MRRAGKFRARRIQKVFMAELVFRDYSAFYKYKKQYYVALDKINLTLGDGVFTVVAGPSGCGKTTLLKCVAGLHDLTQGELLSDGENTENIPPSRRSIAYVAQEYSLYPQMTVYENIAYPLRLMKAPFDETDRRVKQIAGELEISWLLTRKPKQLSGGQQQRVAIARALVRNPRVILFDEPFSNLEHPLRLKMQQLVKELHARRRQSVIFVTHDLTEAFALAENIIILNEGAVEQQGAPDEIISHPKSKFVREFLGL